MLNSLGRRRCILYQQKIFSSIDSISNQYATMSKPTKEHRRVSKKVNDIPRNEYYNEFMKLLKAQREFPFLYTTKDIDFQKVDLPFLKTNFDQIKQNEVMERSFSSLGVSQELQKKLLNENFTTPLPVQSKSLPSLLRGKKGIIMSSTGSGKTLTYLLPIVQNIGKNSCANIIITPTRELASQVYKEALKYVPDKRLVSRHVSGVNVEHEKKLNHALKDSRILIGTPKKLLEIVENHLGYFRQVQCVVLDEVDKLLPYNQFRSKHSKLRSSKPKPTEKLLSIFTYYQSGVQLIATSATISKNLVQELHDLGFGKDCSVFNMIPEEFKYGKIPENIRHYFAKYPEDDEQSKLKYIGRLFSHSKEKCMLVFIDRSESVEQAVSVFKEIGFTATALYKELLLPAPNSFENFLASFKRGDIQIVVATEETVRGMDFPFVNNVYITYLPDTPEHYIHVAGRVGRLDNPGTAVTILPESNWNNEKKRLKKRFSTLGITGKFLKY